MIETIQNATGGLWPYLVVIIIGFLPTEIWRVLGVFAGRKLDEDSEIIAWVRMVATALVAGVVAKLLLFPSGALAVVPIGGRLGALAVGIGAYFALRRSVFGGLLAAEAVLITAGLAFSQAAP